MRLWWLRRVLCTLALEAEECEALNWKVPRATALHMMAEKKPDRKAEAAVHRAYVSAWSWATAVLHGDGRLDVRHPVTEKTPLMHAAMQNNEVALVAMMLAGAGGSEEFRDDFYLRL